MRVVPDAIIIQRNFSGSSKIDLHFIRTNTYCNIYCFWFTGEERLIGVRTV